MKALAITAQGDPVAPNVSFIDVPDVTPGPGELRVRTEASAFNHLDLWVGRGLPGVNTQYPHVSGSDGCGVVDAMGDGVDASLMGENGVGDRPTLPWRSDEIAGGDSGIIKEDFTEVHVGGDVHDGSCRESWGFHVHKKETDSGLFLDLGVRPHETEDPVGLVRVAGPDLLTIDHKVVAIADSSGPQGCQIGTGRGL